MAASRARYFSALRAFQERSLYCQWHADSFGGGAAAPKPQLRLIRYLARRSEQRLLNDQIVACRPVRRALAQDGGHERLKLQIIEHLSRAILNRDKLLALLIAIMRFQQAQA